MERQQIVEVVQKAFAGEKIEVRTQRQSRWSSGEFKRFTVYIGKHGRFYRQNEEFEVSSDYNMKALDQKITELKERRVRSAQADEERRERNRASAAKYNAEYEKYMAQYREKIQGMNTLERLVFLNFPEGYNGGAEHSVINDLLAETWEAAKKEISQK